METKEYFENLLENKLSELSDFNANFFEDNLIRNSNDFNLSLESFVMNYDTKLNEKDFGLSSSSIMRKCFGYSNENLAGVFNHILSKRNKLDRVALVGSSGDQVLNALYYGAKDVTLVDGNPMSESVTELKMAYVKNLPYEEFIKIWENNYFDGEYTKRVPKDRFENLLNTGNYAKVSHSLNDNSKAFWDNIMLNIDDKETLDIIATIFKEYTFSVVSQGKIIPHSSGSSFFKNKSEYRRLQNILNKGDYKIDYITAHLEDFPKVLEGKFDLIALSNIYDYVRSEDFNRVVDNLSENSLKEGGVIQLYYMFNNKYNAPNQLAVTNGSVSIEDLPKKHKNVTAIPRSYLYIKDEAEME